MFDRNKNERIIELFLFDIYIAILKKKLLTSLINQVEPNLKDELIDSFTEDNKYFDFIVERLNKLKS